LPVFFRRAALTAAGRGFFFLAPLEGADREAASARINWSFRIACQPVMPLSRAS
jgi:hypothetical protein